MQARSGNLNTVWTRHLKDKKARDKLEADLRHYINSPLALRLVEILKQELASTDRDRISDHAYSKASWPYRQASLNGKQEALTFVLTLLTQFEEKQPNE